MICPQCQTELPDNAAFCGNCGIPLTQTQPTPTTQEQMPQQYEIPAQPTVTTSDMSTSMPVATPGQNVQPQSPMYQQAPAPQTVIVNNNIQKNGVGTAGFVCALIAIFTSWIPVVGWIVWLVGAVLSVIGLFKKPKGLAIAGTVISFIDVILLILLIGGLASLGTFM